MPMKISLAAAGMTIALAGGAHAQSVIGNVCGVPVWHHSGSAVTMFQLNPSTSPLPGGLSPSSFYFIPAGPSAAFPTVGHGNIVSAVDVVLRQALGQPGCYDVLSTQFTTDDGTGNQAIDSDVPSE